MKLGRRYLQRYSLVVGDLNVDVVSYVLGRGQIKGGRFLLVEEVLKAGNVYVERYSEAVFHML